MNLDPARIHRILRGEDRSPRAALLRGLTAAAEPFYAGAMRLRNAAYANGWKRPHALPAPTISVGNITTGGTGKTPVVRWLADQLRREGRRPAVLMRGYRSTADGGSDEQQLLERALNAPVADDVPRAVPVIANPDRIAGATEARRREPTIDSFILDDGFQHRRVSRTYDLVLINAADPFGGGRVLPRGLLREPMSGLRRASAFLITRSNAASPAALAEIEARLRERNATAPIYHCDHLHTGLTQWPGGAALTMEALGTESILAFCGLGDPESFGRQLKEAGVRVAAQRWFPDHHAYSAQDLRDLQLAAADAGAARLVTTAKDWTKIAPLAEATQPLPVCVVGLEIRFHADDEQQLLAGIQQSLG